MFALLALPALSSMIHYSPRGLHLSLRQDSDVQVSLTGELRDVMNHFRKAHMAHCFTPH